MLITSSQNSKIKEIVTFYKKPTLLKQRNLVLIEGLKEISVAVKSNVEFISVYYCSKIIDYSKVLEIIGIKNKNTISFDIDIEVFKKIVYRESVGGILVLAKRPILINLDNLKIEENSIFIILDALEKPGNLGAIARIADAVKLSGIILTSLRTDIYNPNAVRSSIGSVFSNNVVSASIDETIVWLKKNNIKSFAAELTNSNYYYKENFSGKIALIFGTEAIGLPKQWITNADRCIKIPMLGKMDSLNVNTSVAIITFEALRQRLLCQ